MSARVILVVDRAFGAKILDLPADVPVWIVDSAENRPAVEARRARIGDSTTCFRADTANAPADLASVIVTAIEDHHGAYSQQPAFVRLTIVGAPRAPSLHARLSEFGFEEIPADGSTLEYVRKNG